MSLCFRIVAFGFIAALLVLVFFFLNFIILLQGILKGKIFSLSLNDMARRVNCLGAENFV